MSSPAATPSPSQRPSLLLAVCCLAQFMVILDVSIVNIAIPSIHASLGFSENELPWVINAYTVTFAGFLMLSGRAADLFGQRSTFVTGLLVFALASLAGGTAVSREMLVGARALQGLGGAIMAAASLAIITSSFAPGPERHRAVGLWGAMSGAGGATGTLLGGIITQELTWRWVLLINLPIGIAGALVARAVVAERHRARGQTESFDLAGALAITGGLLALVYGIVNAGANGWASPKVLGPITLGLIALAGFVWIEGRLAPVPLVPLRVFSVRPLRVANAIVLLLSAAMFPMWFFTTLYLQEVLHMPPLGAGLAFLPMALTIMACATRAGPMVARKGVRSVLGGGLITMALGLALFAVLIDVNGSYASSVLLPGLLVAIGIGFSVVPSTIAATASAEPSEAGLVSGLVNTSRQMGGALGLAILSSLGVELTHHLINVNLLAPPLALTDGFRFAYLIGAIFTGAAAFITFRYIPKPRAAAAGAKLRAAAAGAKPRAAQPGATELAQEPVSPPGYAAPLEPALPSTAASQPAPLPVPSPNGGVRVQARRPVAMVEFWIAGERPWPVARGSMTVRIASGGSKRAGRMR